MAEDTSQKNIEIKNIHIVSISTFFSMQLLKQSGVTI